MGACTVTLNEQYTIYKTNKPNELRLWNPFKKQQTEIFCSSKNSQVISKVAITTIKKWFCLLNLGKYYYTTTDSNKHDPDS